MSDVTKIASKLQSGDAEATELLMTLVYDELRALAAAKLAKEKPGQTLQATALVHEAYLRMLGGHWKPDWQSRTHFFSAAAEAMRRILVDRARRKSRPKHGGDRERVELSESQIMCDTLPDVELLDLHEALDLLAKKDARKAELVKLRFFAGLTIREAAELLGISESMADLDWAYAKTWLRAEMTDRRTEE